MKTIIIILACLSAYPAFAQHKSNIALHMKEKELVSILDHLKKTYHVPLAFDNKIKGMKQKISIDIESDDAAHVLSTLLSNTKLTFKKVGQSFAIYALDYNGSNIMDKDVDAPSEVGPVYLSGYISDNENGESLINAVMETSEGQASVTNLYGYYSIPLNKGSNTIKISYIGYETIEEQINVNDHLTKNFRLNTSDHMIKEVLVVATDGRAKEMVRNTEMSKLSVPMEILKKVPVLFGESDILKAIQLLPGIKRGREGGLGMYIRGGSSDENLILLDEAAVYNPGHLLGFLSVFNSNSLKSTDIYKGAFPAQYGGRLSGVLDVRMKEGNDKNIAAEGSIGNISSSLTIEAPIIKERCSFIISGRRSYIDQLIPFFPYYFYDLNAKVNYKINENDRVYASAYLGRDILDISEESDSTDFDLGFGFNQGNTTSTVRWNHIYRGNKLFHNLTVISSNFKYNVGGRSFDSSIDIRSSITDLGLKLDYDYTADYQTQIKFGGQWINHVFRPNLFVTQGDSIEIEDQPIIVIRNHELGVYASIDHSLTDRMKINAGLRLTGSIDNQNQYFNLEPRTSFRYQLSERHSIKGGYARMNQYLHLIAGSTIALPTDLWYPATKTVKPGQSDQVNFGYYTYAGKNDDIQLSLESYYKTMQHLVEYKEGARIILNNDYEKELVFGKGHAYGLEAMIQKNKGIVTGWIGYTLSWSKRQFDDINDGQTYYAKYDRRHDVAAVISLHSPSHDRLGLSFAWVYSSGSPFTPITAKYIQPLPNYSGIDLLPIYGARNSYRLNGSSRLDIDFVYYGKKHKRFRGEWHIGAYNALNKVQPSRVVVTYDKTTNKEKYQEKGIFGFIFSIAYKFQF